MAETTLEPESLARTVALGMADAPEQVGEFAEAIALEDHVTDFRFACGIKGYEGWQWSVTLYHDADMDRWTVDESSLVPTESALRPPAWVPWKDRLEPTDLSVTDSIGTDPDDPRLEEGLPSADTAADTKADAVAGNGSDAADATPDEDHAQSGEAPSDVAGDTAGTDGTSDAAGVDSTTVGTQDVADAVQEFDLSRRHVLSSLGRAQTAKRWYEGPRGPKSLSTKTADGNMCANCGFLVPLTGELSTMFGVCANKWSPDDGRVVSLDHGCGEHSEIDPPEPSHLWVQSKPAYDNLHIDVIAQTPREERDMIDLIERLRNDGIKVSKGIIVLRSQLPM